MFECNVNWSALRFVVLLLLVVVVDLFFSDSLFLGHFLWIRHYSKHFTNANSPNFCCSDVAEGSGELEWPDWGVLIRPVSAQREKGEGAPESDLEKHEPWNPSQVTWKEAQAALGNRKMMAVEWGDRGSFGIEKLLESGNEWIKVDDLLPSSRVVWITTLCPWQMKSWFY